MYVNEFIKQLDATLYKKTISYIAARYDNVEINEELLQMVFDHYVCFIQYEGYKWEAKTITVFDSFGWELHKEKLLKRGITKEIMERDLDNDYGYSGFFKEVKPTKEQQDAFAKKQIDFACRMLDEAFKIHNKLNNPVMLEAIDVISERFNLFETFTFLNDGKYEILSFEDFLDLEYPMRYIMPLLANNSFIMFEHGYY